MKTLIILLLSFGPCSAAFNATTIWRTSALSGSDTNGGAFDPGVVSPGTDESCGASVTCASGGADTAGTAITVTLVSGTTGTCSPGCTSTTHGPGNFIYIASGTGCTLTTWYEIKSQAAGTITVDKTMGSAANVCVGTIGGPLADIATPATQVIAGNVVGVRADATYLVTANITMSTVGTAVAPIIYQGYTSTLGDGGQVTVQANSVALSGIFTISGTTQVDNFILDSNSQAGTTRGLITSANGTVINNVTAKNFATSGLSIGGVSVLRNVRATGGLSGCTAGVNITSATSIGLGVVSDTNNCPGMSNSNATGIRCSYCIFANNIGASSHGWNNASNAQTAISLFCDYCVSYGNGGDGFHSLASTLMGITNSWMWGNAGKSINVTSTMSGNNQFDYNAYAAGSTTGITAGPHSITISADPSINGAALNFAPNATAGSALKQTGFPGALQAGGTGNVSIGALQATPPSGQIGYALSQ